MKNSKSILRQQCAIVGLSITLALSVTACGSGSGDGDTKTTLTIATSNDAPFSFTDADDKLVGIDGDIINAIAEKKGWKVKTFVTDFATLIPALKAKKADVIVDAMYITDERKKQISFTDPWYSEGEGMVVPSGSDLTSREQVKGKVLGGQTGTVFADFIKTLGGSETKFFDSQAALIAAVENGQVDAAFTDSAVLGYSLVQKPNAKIKLVKPYTPNFPGIIGAGVRKDDTELLADLNEGFAELKGTPEYLEILKRYGLSEENVAK